MTSALDEKWRHFNCFFQSREQVVVRRGQNWRIGLVLKTLEAQAGQFLLGCKCPVSQGIVVQEQDPLGDLPMAFFLQNVLQLHQQRWVILHVDSWIIWKIINEEDTILISKNRGENYSSGFLPSEFFGAGWAAMPPLHWLLLVSGSQRYSQVLSMVINYDRKSFGSRWKNSKSCSDEWHHWRFWSVFRHFGTHFAESFCMSKSSWMMDQTRSREMPGSQLLIKLNWGGLPRLSREFYQ